jgi:hypothetical protein
VGAGCHPRQGAFRRFKDLIHQHGIQQQWYDFRDREIECIVADWLDTHEIAYEGEDRNAESGL